MNAIMSQINFDQMLNAFYETMYMAVISLVLAVIFGIIIGILLYCTQTGGLFENKIVATIVDFLINVFRAIPYILLLILLFGFAKFLTGKTLGVNAALPSLVVSATPFFARLTVIAFNEVDKGTIEASKSMGASNWQIIYKILVPEALPALVSGVAVTGITLVAYTAMAGAIGSGGLGNLAFTYGYARRNYPILYTATIILIIIVFIIQAIGDKLVTKIDKR
jgi:D-methionine transport system permease protein